MSELTEKARALADAATPQPWALWGDDDEVIGVVICEMWPTSIKVMRSNAVIPFANTPDPLDNAAFIVEARTLVPALCDEIDAQAARIRELAAELRRAKGFGQEKIG